MRTSRLALALLTLLSACDAPDPSLVDAGPLPGDGGGVDARTSDAEPLDAGPRPPVQGEVVAELRVINDLDEERRGEMARSGVPLPRSANISDLGQLSLVDASDAAVDAQLRPLARWGSGPDDASAPVSWVEVSAQLDVAPGATSRLRLVRAAPPPVAAPLSLVGNVAQTGAARFHLDPSSPALLSRLEIGATTLDAQAGSGPRVVLGDGTVLGADAVTGLEFEVLESGPLRLVVRQRGVLSGSGAPVCASGGGYPSLAYELEAHFARGRGDVELRFLVRNRCGGTDRPFNDQAVQVTSAAFELGLGAPQSLLFGTGGAGTLVDAQTLQVAQRRGGGQPWTRRAEVVQDGAIVETAEFFVAPWAGLIGSGWAMAGQLAFQRYREPQAVGVREGRLVLSAISEPLRFGEAKSIWNHAHVAFGADAAAVERAIEDGRRALERGLLFHADATTRANAAGLLPLEDSGDGALDAAYEASLATLHADTVSIGGQWSRARGYGSQLWPETVNDPWAVDLESPEQHPSSMNYWNPLGVELLEHLRTGDPSYAWEMALPAAWLQAHTAYYNLAGLEHGLFDGVAVTSGGTGEGDWHRSGAGSDDYTYSAGLDLAYLTRPERALRDRFGDAGRSLARRYALGKDRESEREVFLNARTISRQVIQHLELLFDCAQFVPDSSGGDVCRTRLHEIVSEMASDNLSAGVLCQSDLPSDPCRTPQQFMQAALMFEFFVRYELTYPGRIPELRGRLVEVGRTYARFGLPLDGEGRVDVSADFSAGMACELNAERSAALDCTPIPNSDNRTVIYAENRPHTLAMLWMADRLDPERAQCEMLREALRDPGFAGLYDPWVGASGYWKGINQALQNLVFAVGAPSCP